MLRRTRVPNIRELAEGSAQSGMTYRDLLSSVKEPASENFPFCISEMGCTSVVATEVRQQGLHGYLKKFDLLLKKEWIPDCSSTLYKTRFFAMAESW